MHRHTAFAFGLVALVSGMFALAHWHRIPVPPQPQVTLSCRQPDVARQLAREGVTVTFTAAGDHISETQARDSIDAQLRTEANMIAAQYQTACAEEACSAQKTGEVGTRPDPYMLTPLPDGGYRAADGTVADFFVKIECVRRVRRSG